MSGRNLVLTGVPRSGTTLCCSLLGRAVDAVALFEPMDVATLPVSRKDAQAAVARFFDDSRRSLLADGSAWSQQVAGKVPDNPFANHRGADGQRRREAERGRIVVDKPLSPDFTLVIKHNAAFTALLPELAQQFETCAIVRNPLAVLASWHSVDLPVSHGRLPAGERLDPKLAECLDREPDTVARQLLILDWLFDRYLSSLPSARVIPYERVVSSGAAVLADAYRLTLPTLALDERNASRLYDVDRCSRLLDRLLADRGAWRQCYVDEDIEGLMERMREGAA